MFCTVRLFVDKMFQNVHKKIFCLLLSTGVAMLRGPDGLTKEVRLSLSIYTSYIGNA